MADAIRENVDYWENLAPHRHGGGDEAISLAQLGADSIAIAIDIDIAPSTFEVDAPRPRLGVSVDFRTADMTALPDDLRALDVIYISWRGLCWVPA